MPPFLKKNRDGDDPQNFKEKNTENPETTLPPFLKDKRDGDLHSQILTERDSSSLESVTSIPDRPNLDTNSTLPPFISKKRDGNDTQLFKEIMSNDQETTLPPFLQHKRDGDLHSQNLRKNRDGDSDPEVLEEKSQDYPNITFTSGDFDFDFDFGFDTSTMFPPFHFDFNFTFPFLTKKRDGNSTNPSKKRDGNSTNPTFNTQRRVEGLTLPQFIKLLREAVSTLSPLPPMKSTTPNVPTTKAPTLPPHSKTTTPNLPTPTLPPHIETTTPRDPLTTSTTLPPHIETSTPKDPPTSTSTLPPFIFTSTQVPKTTGPIVTTPPFTKTKEHQQFMQTKTETTTKVPTTTEQSSDTEEEIKFNGLSFFGGMLLSALIVGFSGLTYYAIKKGSCKRPRGGYQNFDSYPYVN